MSEGEPFLPPEIRELVELIKRLNGKNYVTREDRSQLRQAKLGIAYWACRKENLAITRQNLAHVMGPDSEEVLDAYDKFIEGRAAGGGRRWGRKPRGDFWGKA
jgi:hypothetical protein